ncbi:MAG: hypothetical protein Q9160_006484 [Pyrenula sp. 1 TL-2023]
MDRQVKSVPKALGLNRSGFPRIDFQSERQVDGTVDDITKVLGFVSTIFDLVRKPSAQSFQSSKHQKRVNELEQQLSCIKLHIPDEDGRTADARESMIAMKVQVYRLAGLIYLHRAVKKYSGLELRHRQLVEQAFTAVAKVRVLWPLFIVACEAQTDVDRRRILEVFDEGQRQWPTGNIAWVRRMVEAFWNQDDLDAEQQELDYVTKMTAVVSAAPFLPTFA